MWIHKYVVHYSDFDLITQVCDDCTAEFEARYGDLPRSYGGVYRSWACCNFCRVVVYGVVEAESELPQESKQLEFDFMKDD